MHTYTWICNEVVDDFLVPVHLYFIKTHNNYKTSLILDLQAKDFRLDCLDPKQPLSQIVSAINFYQYFVSMELLSDLKDCVEFTHKKAKLHWNYVYV